MKKFFYTIFFIGFFLLPTAYLFGQQDKSLDFVVEPYLTDISDSSFRVLWETTLPAKGEVHLIKTEPFLLNPDMKIVARENESALFHKLTVSGLNRSDLYYYQVISIGESGDTLRGRLTPLSIPDYNHSAVSFSVVGDTQGNPVVWKKISELMAEETPHFIVHVGDLVQYGPNKDDWTDEFFRPAKTLLSYTPLYPASGNHEMNDEKLYQYFDLPYDNAFYTVKKGDIIFIFVDTNKDILVGSEQYNELKNVLASSKETWKIVIHHHPVFTSHKFSYRSSLMAAPTKGDPNILHLKDLYETYCVDLTLAGHVHNYERTWPIRENQINEEEGVTHIITGGGGGDFIKTPNDRNWFSVEAKNIHHFLNVRVWKNKLHVEAIDTTGCVFDIWEKEKEPSQVNLIAPLLGAEKSYFIDSTSLSIVNKNETGSINYRLNDGQYQTEAANEKLFVLKNTTTVSSFINSVNGRSRESVKTVVRLPLMVKQKPAGDKIKADYYEGIFTLLPDFDSLKPVRSFSLHSLSLTEIQPRIKDHFAVRFKGTLYIPETGVYRFFLESFDGSRLIIDGKEIINNDGVHYEIFMENYAALEKGAHHFEVQYFDFKRRETLNLLIGEEGGEMFNINEFISPGKGK
ncbi:hypothetical protein D1164_00285 [Mariniphaga sediminis]|uniref:PA14 domain-containing protein n=1 Tax=Mariniphaga sediminis TaxID=1628158 RepID=A0A399D5I4_9BACT|nr:metallophosphoesterase [Mariniphaga sediminis]RIH66909.1 hypothetical protein D1164_00285 [Mariniphaga sediminis]